ncbi:MAG TPA: hypothetical protein VFD58_08235 [Blastocatellia bacterium]|nr:hypothetical protein [Blastocatellia bacterium]
MTDRKKQDPTTPPGGQERLPREEKDAVLVEICAMPGRARFFCILYAEGRQLRYYGTRRELAKQITAIGHQITPDAIRDGLRLDLRCRVRIVSAGDRSLIEELLPAQPDKEE